MFTASRLQVAVYLLGICPFSIAFLVFLNSSVSFVITDLLGLEHHVGTAVGDLGFADELLALFACPFWGWLSDKIGVRWVCVLGYTIISLALVVFVQAKNVYPQLLLARLFFSVGGAAASTMVTAVLPTMSYEPDEKDVQQNGNTNVDYEHAPSVTSDITITPTRYRSRQTNKITRGGEASESAGSTARVSGFVGMFTGCGALIALAVFLPLPAMFQKQGLSPGRALQDSYYIVAVVAFTLALICVVGLRNLGDESQKSFRSLFRQRDQIGSTDLRGTSHSHDKRSLFTALTLCTRSAPILVGYVGGFVARASSVGVSLFIPLLINAAFRSSGLCHNTSGTPAGLPDIKRRCPQAYILAAQMTGISQAVALVSAPIFGYATARYSSIPLIPAALAGMMGYPLFATQFDPDASQRTPRILSYVGICLIGISQIGAIVCSLASLSRGVLSSTQTTTPSPPPPPSHPSDTDASEPSEHEALLTTDTHPPKPSLYSPQSLQHLKGAIAGVYSFFGGLAILLLTKIGGVLFDKVDRAWPSYMLAGFNAVMLVVVVGIAVGGRRERR